VLPVGQRIPNQHDAPQRSPAGQAADVGTDVIRRAPVVDQNGPKSLSLPVIEPGR